MLADKRRVTRPAGLWPVYAFGYAWMFLVIQPVLVPFLLRHGVTMAGVFGLQAAYGATVMLLEVPTGYLCDRIGRKRVLVLGAACNALGFLLLAALPTLVWFTIAELLLGAAWSLVSGADVALIYDLLDTIGGDRPARRRALANYQLALVLGEASASLVCGALALWSLAAVAWGAAIAGVAPLVLACLLRAPHVPRASAGFAVDLRAVFDHVLRDRDQRRVLLNMMLWGLSTYIAVWLLQPYWQLCGIGLQWFGLLWGATLLTVGVVARATPRIEHRIGPGATLGVIGAAPILAYACMAAAPGLAGVAGSFLFYVSRGLNSVFLREVYNHAIPARLRATCNSVASGSFRLTFCVCGPLIGVSVDRVGLRPTLWGLAACFAIVFITVALPLIRNISASIDKPAPRDA